MKYWTGGESDGRARRRKEQGRGGNGREAENFRLKGREEGKRDGERKDWRKEKYGDARKGKDMEREETGRGGKGKGGER